MADQTIKPLLPVTKTRNNLQPKKVKQKKPESQGEKADRDKNKTGKNGIDTFA